MASLPKPTDGGLKSAYKGEREGEPTMQELIKQLQHLKKCNEDLLFLAEVNKNKEKIDFYRGELQGLKTAITFAECRMKKKEAI